MVCVSSPAQASHAHGERCRACLVWTVCAGVRGQADILICVYCRKIDLDSIRVILKSIGPILNFQRVSFISRGTDLNIFTPVNSKFTPA